MRLTGDIADYHRKTTLGFSVNPLIYDTYLLHLAKTAI